LKVIPLNIPLQLLGISILSKILFLCAAAFGSE
jgi:hypothetical protein